MTSSSQVSTETWLHDLRNPATPALIYNPLSQEEDSDNETEDHAELDTGTCCKFNYNGSSLIVSYNNDTIYLYNTHDNTEYKHKYTGHRNHDTVKGVNFYGLNSEYVMSGSDCGHIFLWNTTTEDIVQCLVGEEDGIVNVLEFNPYSPMIASSGLEHCVKIWTPNLEDETQLSNLSEIVEKNASRDSLSHDVLTIFLSRMSGEELQNSCRQS
ncbi:DDB1- and CUL4-associated factor 8-like [Bolinopsis microptera]|uniref:DDB1- and CUL4-associated factor 8-like n=1 Tax=Bolinopsis microptera TaxID=2820187 RepID=UPI00307AC442